METKNIDNDQRKQFNNVATHPLQSYEWGEFREKTGIKVLRRGILEKNSIVKSFQLTIHPIPFTPWTIGYLPKGYLPDKFLLESLHQIGLQEKCIFIQLEPNILKLDGESQLQDLMNHASFQFLRSHKPLFTKYSFLLDLTTSEDELLKHMHPKTRYNIKIAKKHGVEIIEDNSDEAFASYLKLMEETTKRQRFYAHSKNYHRSLWDILSQEDKNVNTQLLQARLFLAKYTPPKEKKSVNLAAWIVFTFHDVLYYPYGASTNSYKNVMATNLLMWEVIRFGKKLSLKKFDMWGSLSENPDPHDPWYGFHRFKQGYGPKLVEYVGSFDFVINPFLYRLYITMNTLRWHYLRWKSYL